MQGPPPSVVPSGTTSYPVLGEPLPDIFGTSTGPFTSRPLSPPPLQRTAEPSVARYTQAASPITSPAQAAAPATSPIPVDNSAVDGNSPTSLEVTEVVTDDDNTSFTSEASPEGMCLMGTWGTHSESTAGAAV